MGQTYYAVRWGDAEDGDPEKGPNMESDHVRIEKASSPKEACMLCWGLVSSNMWVKDLGTRKSVITSTKKRIELLTSKDGWTRVGGRRWT